MGTGSVSAGTGMLPIESAGYPDLNLDTTALQNVLASFGDLRGFREFDGELEGGREGRGTHYQDLHHRRGEFRGGKRDGGRSESGAAGAEGHAGDSAEFQYSKAAERSVWNKGFRVGVSCHILLWHELWFRGFC